MQASLHELKSIVLWIQERTNGLVLPAGRRCRMAFGCLDLAIEHQAGISILADQEFWGPAFALLRPLLDAVSRGLWLATCATDSDLDEFERNGLRNKSFRKLIEEVERSLGHTEGALSRLARSSWGPLSDFTHCGFQHVVRRNSPTQTGPNYKDQEKAQVLNLATSLGLFAVMGLASQAGHEDVARAAFARAKQFATTRDANKQL